MNTPVQIHQAGGIEQASLMLPGLMFFIAGGPIIAAGGDALLLEIGDNLLLETGDNLLLE